MPKGKGLKDEPYEYRLQQYEEKNTVLGQFGEPVSAWTLYEDIFGDLGQLMPVVIIDENEQKHMVKMTVEEAIETAQGRNDVLMGGCTYFKEFVSKHTAKDIHAFIIDMDNVYSGILLMAFQSDWATANGVPLPMPTYIVNSGVGLHLYYVLDEPLPHYRRSAEDIDKLYRELAEQQTTHRNYLRRQVQWFGQDFRMAGGCGKDMWLNQAYRVGKKWGADELAAACGLDIHFPKIGDEWEPRHKDELHKKHKPYQKREGWHSNRAFYDSALRQCREKSVEGWRYTSMCALAVIAWKCNVPYDEVAQDLYALLPSFNKNAERKVKEREVKSALKMYNEKAMTTTRARLEDWQGWKYTPIKRNGRSQEKHLQGARAIENINNENWRDGNGRKSKEQAVREWQEAHPNGIKAECIKETGLSKPTVYKWWKERGRMKKEKKYKEIDILCRGCAMRGRERLWFNYVSSISDEINRKIDNSYMEFEAEPTNKYDPNAIKVMCRGEFYGIMGYVGREYTGEVKEILKNCAEYRLDMKDESQAGEREITLKLKWKEKEKNGKDDKTDS